jgi:hypothetical protein
MPDMTAIASALSSFKALKDIAEAMIGLRDAASFRERQIEFQGKIIDAQSALMALQDERATLVETIRHQEAEIARLKAWEAEKERYELKQVTIGGSLTYVLKPDAQGTEPPHWICAACYQVGKKSILQRGDTHGGDWFYRCPRCTASVRAPWEAFPSSPY